MGAPLFDAPVAALNAYRHSSDFKDERQRNSALMVERDAGDSQPILLEY
jgi:hypothetical protein